MDGWTDLIANSAQIESPTLDDNCFEVALSPPWERKELSPPA